MNFLLIILILIMQPDILSVCTLVFRYNFLITIYLTNFFVTILENIFYLKEFFLRLKKFLEYNMFDRVILTSCHGAIGICAACVAIAQKQHEQIAKCTHSWSLMKFNVVVNCDFGASSHTIPAETLAHYCQVCHAVVCNLC